MILQQSLSNYHMFNFLNKMVFNTLLLKGTFYAMECLMQILIFFLIFTFFSSFFLLELMIQAECRKIVVTYFILFTFENLFPLILYYFQLILLLPLLKNHLNIIIIIPLPLMKDSIIFVNHNFNVKIKGYILYI